MKINAVIFDFDGLILDTESTLYESWRRIYADYGCTLSLDQWAANIGGYSYEVFHPIKNLEKLFGKTLDHGAVKESQRAWYLDQVHQQEALPGALDALRAVKAMGLKLGVASSSSTNWVPVHLERLGVLDLVDAMRCGNQVAAVKPDPAVYLEVLDELNAGPETAIAFEDSPKGVAAAKAAQLYCIGVTNAVTEVLGSRPG